MTDFRCPRCGGPYFGRPDPIARPRLVWCHCDKQGRPVSAVPGDVTRREDYCGWRGDEAECGLGDLREDPPQT